MYALLKKQRQALKISPPKKIRILTINYVTPNIRIGNPKIRRKDYLLINNCLGILLEKGNKSSISTLLMLLITYVRYSSLFNPLALAV